MDIHVWRFPRFVHDRKSREIAGDENKDAARRVPEQFGAAKRPQRNQEQQANSGNSEVARRLRRARYLRTTKV